MPDSRSIAHPYIPNSTARAKEEMMREIGIEDITSLYSQIPPELKLDRPLQLPEPCRSEFELRRHVTTLLEKNKSTSEYLSFLGSGCYQHYVPAVCDEINSRNEFLTSYSGKAYEDHGRWQALFEYTSLMGELLNMDVVNLPTYDGLQAAATAVRMAANITGRNEIVIAKCIHPDKRSKVLEYNRHLVTFKFIDFDPQTGQLDLSKLEQTVSSGTAAIYFDNPNFFGVIETHGQEICDLAHRYGALCIVGADPISLGILKPPADYGADIACGDIQSLGIHMQFGGGHAGYIATRDEEKFVMQYPNRIVGVLPTKERGEYGFGEVAFSRTSFITREKGKEWLGTMANLWGMTAGVYLALMGPQGMAEIGQVIIKHVRYAMQELSKLKDVSVQFHGSAHFREFIVDFSPSKKPVAEIHRALRARGIFGGYDISGKFPGFENHAIYCITEVHTKEDIDRLVRALSEVLA